jgi:hypothetical protein
VRTRLVRLTAEAVERPSLSTTKVTSTRSASSSGAVSGGGTKHEVMTVPSEAVCGSSKSTNPKPLTCGRKVPVRRGSEAEGVAAGRGRERGRAGAGEEVISR